MDTASAAVLQALRSTIQDVQVWAASQGSGSAGCVVTGALGEEVVEAVEHCLSWGLEARASLWDWVRQLEAADEAWASEPVAQLKAQRVRDPCGRELGRRWLRRTLNDATLSAALERLAELPPEACAAFYRKNALLRGGKAAYTLRSVLMPIAGLDPDTLRAREESGAAAAAEAAATGGAGQAEGGGGGFIRFKLNVCSPEDSSLPLLSDRAILDAAQRQKQRRSRDAAAAAATAAPAETSSSSAASARRIEEHFSESADAVAAEATSAPPKAAADDTPIAANPPTDEPPSPSPSPSPPPATGGSSAALDEEAEALAVQRELAMFRKSFGRGAPAQPEATADGDGRADAHAAAETDVDAAATTGGGSEAGAQASRSTPPPPAPSPPPPVPTETAAGTPPGDEDSTEATLEELLARAADARALLDDAPAGACRACGGYAAQARALHTHTLRLLAAVEAEKALAEETTRVAMRIVGTAAPPLSGAASSASPPLTPAAAAAAAAAAASFSASGAVVAAAPVAPVELTPSQQAAALIASGGRFCIHHPASGLSVTVASSQVDASSATASGHPAAPHLVLTRLKIPAAFRFEKSVAGGGGGGGGAPCISLVHAESGLVVRPGPPVGWDPSLTLQAASAAGSGSAEVSWGLDDAEVPEGDGGKRRPTWALLVEDRSRKCVHPHGGKASDGRALVMHASRDGNEGGRLGFRLEPLGDMSEACGKAVDDFDDDCGDADLVGLDSGDDDGDGVLVGSMSPPPPPGAAGFNAATLAHDHFASCPAPAEQGRERAASWQPGGGGSDDGGGGGDGAVTKEQRSLSCVSESEMVVKHRMRLLTDLRVKHADYAEKERRIELQNRRCKGCLSELKKVLSPGYLYKRFDTVRFCWYMGSYYCSGCHDNSLSVAIPARLLHLWDARPQPVCSDAYRYLVSVWHKPIVCVSAAAPLLFERVSALADARATRVQLNALHAVVRECPNLALETILPASRLYHLLETELYSPEDLTSFHESQPQLDDTPTIPCKVLKLLHDARDTLVCHVTTGCSSHCYPKAAQMCEACGAGDRLFSFDVPAVRACPRCGKLYHKACYEKQKCARCF